MAYVVGRPNGAWEIRESRSTSAGPRSRTLATFRELDPKVIARARERSSRPLDPVQLRRAAARAGAPLARSTSDRAARDLLAGLRSGQGPRPVLRRLLAAVLAGEAVGVPDSTIAAAPWIPATPQERADTLRDLLLLADRFPHKRRRTRRFPRIDSTSHE